MYFWLFPEFLQGAIYSKILFPFHYCYRTRYQFMIPKRYIKLRLCLFSVVFSDKKKDFVLCIFRYPLNFYKVQISANYEKNIFKFSFLSIAVARLGISLGHQKAYSQTCIKRSPLRQRKTCILRQVSS